MDKKGEGKKEELLEKMRQNLDEIEEGIKKKENEIEKE